jgi:hypothetical protein
MRRLATPKLALGLGALSVLLVLAAIPVEAFDPGSISFNGSPDAFSSITSVTFLLAFAAVGVLVACRQPYNPIGWLMLATALAWEVSDFGSGYADLDYHHHHGALPLGHLALLTDAAQGLYYGLLIFPLIILLFPDGRIGRRWRWPLVIYVLICLLEVGATLSVAVGDFSLRKPLDSGGSLIGLNHPNPFVDNAEAVALFSAFALLIAAVIRQVLSYRRASGERREQLKWLLSGAALCLLSSPIFVDPNASLLNALFPLVLTLIPVTIGIGIVKYRLYEIDRIISRTVSYAILTALLAVTFVGLVVLSTRVLPFSSTVGVAASTLAAAALFNPLRVRVQRTVDRRFNRSRYDAQATVDAFAARLRDAVDLEHVQADLLDVVQRAVQPAHATIWIRSASR